MADSINITYPLGGSKVDSTFTATGYCDPANLTVKGKHGATQSGNSPAANGSWAVVISGAANKNDLTVYDVNNNATSGTEPNIEINGANAPMVTLAPLLPPQPLVRGGAARSTYTVGGNYNKRNSGVGVICAVVKRNGKKIQEVVAAAAADLKGNGTWTAEISVDAPGAKNRHTVFAFMIDEDGKVITQVGGISDPQA